MAIKAGYLIGCAASARAGNDRDSTRMVDAAVMLLVEQSKVGLDDSVTKYFPKAPAAWKAITIRHLLAHTSGIPDIVDEPEANPSHKAIPDFHRDYTEDELARAYAAQSLYFEPGTKMSYRNTGYQLLGILVHRVTGAATETICESTSLHRSECPRQQSSAPKISSRIGLVVMRFPTVNGRTCGRGSRIQWWQAQTEAC